MKDLASGSGAKSSSAASAAVDGLVWENTNGKKMRMAFAMSQLLEKNKEVINLKIDDSGFKMLTGDLLMIRP